MIMLSERSWRWGSRGERKRTSWIHIHELECAHKLHVFPGSPRGQCIYSISRAGPPFGRVARFTDFVGHSPPYPRTSMFELTVHLELAELCLRVSVCTPMSISCMHICQYVCTCVQVTDHPVLVVSRRDCLFQSADIIYLTGPVPLTSNHTMSSDFEKLCVCAYPRSSLTF